VVKGRDHRSADHPIDPLFLDRWSARAMSGEPIAEADLMVLFEAARWAPSAANVQPWRMLYARRDTEHWPTFLGLLVEANRVWAQHAAALVVFISKTINERTGKPAVTNSYVTGSAWENFALQAILKGFVVHGMQGFDYERARTELKVPEIYRVEAMAAVGIPGPVEDLPEHLRVRETPNGRKPLKEIICEGPFALGD
jgi:nitroreductase